MSAGLPDPLLDIQAAAEFLGVGPRMIRRLVAERRIRFFHVGRVVRLRQSDLEGYLAEHAVEASAAWAQHRRSPRPRQVRPLIEAENGAGSSPGAA